MPYTRVFTEEKWNRVLKENKNLMEDFLLEYKQRKKKQTTLDQYLNDLRIIMIYILEKCNNKSILEMNKRDFRNFSLWLSDECAMSSARCNRLMSCARSLLTYAEDDDEYDYDINVAKKVKGLHRESVREIHFLSNDLIIKMCERLIEEEEYQKATLLMLLFDSAGRKNEVAQVNKHSFGDDNKNCTNKVVGKRGKIFPLLYFTKTKEYAKLWLEQRGEDDIDSLWIIGSGKNKRAATSENIYDWIISMRKLVSEITGKDIDFNVHSLRHSSLECYSDGTHYVCQEVSDGNGFPVEKLKLIAHHESIDTTNGYLKDKSDEELENMFGIKME